MDIQQIDKTLPNGFHDAYLKKYSVDYASRIAIFEIDIWHGTMDDEGDKREEYRLGQLMVTDLLGFVVDVPNNDLLDIENILGIGIGLNPPGTVDSPLAKEDQPLPPGAFSESFYFTNDCLSYLHLAGMEATWEFISEPRNH